MCSVCLILICISLVITCHLHIQFGKVSINSYLLSTFELIFSFPIVEFYEFLAYFGCKFFSQRCFEKTLAWSVTCFFHSLNSIICRTEVFNFNGVQNINFFFLPIVLQIQEVIAKPKVNRFSPILTSQSFIRFFLIKKKEALN